VAALLAGAWHRSPPAAELSPEELAEIVPLLVRSGAGALGWRRVRHSDLRTSAAAFQLQQAHQLHVLQAAAHTRNIERVFTLLRSAGVEPLLVKGWGVARLYPEKGLRPYGDLDLCVRPEQCGTVRRLFPAYAPESIDLHEGVASLDSEGLDDVFARSGLAPLGEVDVRIPGPEDHLRILCIHLLRHGAWRPLWLCDIALALESRPADFDWELCLGRDPLRADWVACALGLAHQVLGAHVADTPVASRAERLPRWFVPTMLEQWGKPPQYRLPMRMFLRYPMDGLRQIRHHWPNGIEATIGVRGAFSEMPRLLFQLGDGFLRTGRFLAQTFRQVRIQRSATQLRQAQQQEHRSPPIPPAGSG
jgi:hypothetical protein